MESVESPRPSQRRGVASDSLDGDVEVQVQVSKVDKGKGKEVSKPRGLVPIVRPGAVDAVVEESHYYLVRLLCGFRGVDQKLTAHLDVVPMVRLPSVLFFATAGTDQAGSQAQVLDEEESDLGR